MQGVNKKTVRRMLAEKRRHKAWKRIACFLMATAVFCTSYALILPAITVSYPTYCGMDEHTHTEACYTEKAIAQTSLHCTPEAEADFILHTHDALCYDEAGTMICSLTERIAHTHTESCYDDEGTLTCSLPEVEEHIHSEACYSADGYLSCGQAQVLSHPHTEECLDVDEESSVSVSTLSCSIDEHVHTDLCRIQPESLTFTYEDDEINGVITIPFSEELPNDLTCTVVRLDLEDTDYDRMYDAVLQTVDSENEELSDVQLYKLEWQSDGEAYTLPSSVNPVITLRLPEEEDSELTVSGLVLENTADEASSSSSARRKARAVAAETESDDSSDLTVDEPAYTATEVAAEDDTITLSLSGRSASFAVARSLKLTGTIGYYKRIDSLSELQGSKGTGEGTGTYVIVMAEGVIALGPNDVTSTNNYGGQTSSYAAWSNNQPVTVHPVRGTDGNEYYVIRNGANGYIYNGGSFSSIHWNFWDYRNQTKKDQYYWATSPFFLIQNCSTGGYLWLGQDYYYFSGTWKYNWSIGISLEHQDTENVWRMSATSDLGTYWLGCYISGSSVTTITQHDSGSHYTADIEDNFVIYKYIGTSLSTVDDELASSSVETSQVEMATKPDSIGTDASSLSGSKEGSLTAETDSELLGYTLSYASDSATSSIEDEFTLRSQSSKLTSVELHAAQKENDGRILTDKSVIYGKDDYNAFSKSDYKDGEFSVTLSALGQEWMVEEEQVTSSPVDVMFILDLSNSMTTEYDGEARWVSSVDAINNIANEILERNSENRIGLIAFSNEAINVLSLDHYSTANTASGTILSYDASQYIQNKPSTTLATSIGLQNSKGNTVASVSLAYSSSNGLWHQTFTQAALQCAYESISQADTTVTQTNSNGVKETVTRQPVIILLSDGDPTIGSYDYMNPTAGPVYGYGKASEVFGYYTILSSNYFKNMTSLHYNLAAKFYSIGLGITNDDYGLYVRSILNPSESQIDALPDAYSGIKYVLTTPTDTSIYSDNSRYIYEDNMWKMKYGSISALGYTNAILSLTPYRPYEDISYADDAFFGNLTSEQLDQIFESILNRVQQINNYGFILANGSSLTITDYLGEDIEVRGTPVLRYFGTNYSPSDSVTGTDSLGTYTQYIWKQVVDREENDVKEEGEQTIDLSTITVKVYDATDEREAFVRLSIPEAAVPTFYPDLNKQFYYEELPVRLIYRVGLCSGATDDLTIGETKVFYTNSFTSTEGEDTDDTAHAEADTIVSFIPASNNPYYTALARQTDETVTQKTANTTDTAAYSFEEYVTNKVVTQLLGNNGKLSVTKTAAYTVSKVWGEDALISSVRVWLFREKEYEDGTKSATEYVTAKTLDASNAWINTLTGLETEGSDDKGNYVWKYYIAESNTNLFGSRTYYTDSLGNLLDYVTRDVTVKDGEPIAYKGLRMYPFEAPVVITNQAKTLTIQKVWADEEPGADSVTVALYGIKTPILGTVTEPSTELITTFVLNESNHWTATYTATSLETDYNILATQYVDYYVAEMPVDGYYTQYSYSNQEGTLLPVSIEVDGATQLVYPAEKNVTITNSESIQSISLTKKWSDGDENHTEDSAEMALFTQILLEQVQLDPETGEYVTAYVRSYILTSTDLSADTDWKTTFNLDPIGTQCRYGGYTYTIEGYFIAEMNCTLSSGSGSDSDSPFRYYTGYTAEYYSVDLLGNQTKLDHAEAITDFYIFRGGTPTVIGKQRIRASETAYALHVDTPILLYPVSERMLIENTLEDSITVTKTWEEGMTKEPVHVILFAKMTQTKISTGEIVQTRNMIVSPSGTPLEQFDASAVITLSEENNWTYSWSHLYASGQLGDDMVTYEYYLYEVDTGQYLATYQNQTGQTITTTDFDVFLIKGTIPHVTSTVVPAAKVTLGTTTLHNAPKTLTITKSWVGEVGDVDSVQVAVYRRKTKIRFNGHDLPLTEDNVYVDTEFTTVTESWEAYGEDGLVTLSAENNWTITIPAPEFGVELYEEVKDTDGYVLVSKDIFRIANEDFDIIYVYRYDYFVVEQPVSGYAATYLDPATGLEVATGYATIETYGGKLQQTLTFTIGTVYQAGDAILIVNEKGYTLPHTGGMTPQLYQKIGLALILLSGGLFLVMTLRKRKRYRASGSRHPT